MTLGWLVAHLPGPVSNWPSVSAGLLASYTPAGPADLTLRTKRGTTLTSPNRPAARAPLFEVLVYDSYRLSELVGRLSERKATLVLDVGAHVGTFSLALAERLPNLRACCYEPSSATVSYLRGNVERNGLASRISVNAVAVTSRSGKARLRALESADSCATIVGPEDGGELVEVVSFDSIVEEQDSRIDLVKLDCEGSEYDIVEGSTPETFERIDQVVLEYHPRPGGFDLLKQRLGSFGIELVAHQPSTVTPGLGTAWFARHL